MDKATWALEFKEAKNLFAAIAPVAPKIAGCLFGAYGQIAVTILEKALGTSGTEGVLASITADNSPLTAIEAQYGVSLESLANADRENARSVGGSKGALIVDILAGLYTGAFLIACILDALGYVGDNSTIVHNMYSLAILVASYYFGSSVGERR